MTKTTLIPMVLMLTATNAPETITCELVSPVNGNVVSGTIQVTAVCSPNVVKVEFYKNGRLIGVVDRRPQIPKNLRVLHAMNTHTNLPREANP